MVFTQREVKSRKNLILITLAVLLFSASFYLLFTRLDQATPTSSLLADVAMQQTASSVDGGDWAASKLDHNILENWNLLDFKQYFTPIEVESLNRGRVEVFSPTPKAD